MFAPSLERIVTPPSHDLPGFGERRKHGRRRRVDHGLALRSRGVNPHRYSSFYVRLAALRFARRKHWPAGCLEIFVLLAEVFERAHPELFQAGGGRFAVDL